MQAQGACRHPGAAGICALNTVKKALYAAAHAQMRHWAPSPCMARHCAALQEVSNWERPRADLLRPGRSEEEINKDIYDLAATCFGTKKFWHPRLVVRPRPERHKGSVETGSRHSGCLRAGDPLRCGSQQTAC